MIEYSRVLLLYILVLELSSYEADDTEYWLFGTWARQVGIRNASFIFSENRTGSYRIEGGDFGTSGWYFEDEQYWDVSSDAIILDFDHNGRACIVGSWADRVPLSGWYYDYHEDYSEGHDGISLVLRQVEY